jgi:shikimate kinase/3-dehydroquinate synthase
MELRSGPLDHASIVLSGFMGTGKTTVGPLVAARLGVPFVDTDHEIERGRGRKRSPNCGVATGRRRFARAKPRRRAILRGRGVRR